MGLCFYAGDIRKRRYVWCLRGDLACARRSVNGWNHECMNGCLAILLLHPVGARSSVNDGHWSHKGLRVM